MKFSEIELPSNKKFGVFFGCIFWIASAYFFSKSNAAITLGLGLAGTGFLILAIVKPLLLRPLNVGWMRLGYALGMVVSPLVLGVIFFCIFTPVGVILKLIGRDEMALKNRAPSWRLLNKSDKPEQDFTRQY